MEVQPSHAKQEVAQSLPEQTPSARLKHELVQEILQISVRNPSALRTFQERYEGEETGIPIAALDQIVGDINRELAGEKRVDELLLLAMRALVLTKVDAVDGLMALLAVKLKGVSELSSL